jgi:hypothetical protein
VTTGKHSLMGSVHVIVVPHDDGELFSLHFDLQLQVTGYRSGALLPPLGFKLRCCAAMHH